MSESPHQQSRDAPAALILWIVAQSALLIALARGFALSAAWSNQDAVALLCAADVCLSAALLPALLRTWWNVVEATAVAWIMLGWAAVLADVGWRAPLGAGLYLLAWLVLLHALTGWIEPSDRKLLFFNALATLLVIGGAVVAYLGAEFSLAPMAWWRYHPVSSGWIASNPHSFPLSPLAIVGGIALTLLGSGHIFRRKRG